MGGRCAGVVVQALSRAQELADRAMEIRDFWLEARLVVQIDALDLEALQRVELLRVLLKDRARRRDAPITICIYAYYLVRRLPCVHAFASQ